MGGLGYSDNCTGADNPTREYDVAMTMDGAINANFIKTGKLDAMYIKVGSATTFEDGYDPTVIAGNLDTIANSKAQIFKSCPSDGKYKTNDLLIPAVDFVSGSKTFYAGEVYQAWTDGDGVSFDYMDWAEATLMSVWKKTGTTTIDGGQIATDSIEAVSLKSNQAMIEFLNAQNIKAGSVAAENIDAGTINTNEITLQSEDGNMSIAGTDIIIKHNNGTESRLGAAGLNLYDDGVLQPYISTIMADSVSRTASNWNREWGSTSEDIYYTINLIGSRWVNMASRVKVLPSVAGKHVYPMGASGNCTIDYVCEVASIVNITGGVQVKIRSYDLVYEGGYLRRASLGFNYLIVLT